MARKRCKVRRNTHFEHCIYCIGGADCQRCGEVAKLLSRACVGPQASACKCTRLGGLSTRGGMETEGTGGAGHRPRATDIPQFDFFSIWPAFLASPNAGFSTTACAGEGRWSYFRSGADMAAFCRVFMPAGRHGKPDSPPGGGEFFFNPRRGVIIKTKNANQNSAFLACFFLACFASQNRQQPARCGAWEGHLK